MYKTSDFMQKLLKKRGYPLRNGHYVIGDELLGKIGITAHRFNKIVSGEADMTVPELFAIAEAFEIEVDALLEESKQNKAA